MYRKRFIQALTSVTAVGLVAACGSSSSTPKTGAATTTAAAATSSAPAATSSAPAATGGAPAATSGPAPASASSTGAAAEPTGTLTFSGLTSDKDPAEAVIAAFQAKYPKVKVQSTFADVSAYQPQIRTQLTSGTAPDVFFVWPGDGNPAAMKVLHKPNLIADLSSMPWASKTPAGLDSVTKIDGKTYVAVTGIGGIGAIYNETALKAVGVPAPTTFSQVLTFCSAAKAKGKVAFALGNGTDWVTQLIDYALSSTLVYQADPKFADEMSAGQKTFAGSAWQKTMDEYLQMSTAGCFQPKPLGTSVDDSVAMAAKGSAVAVVQGNWELSTLKKLAPAGTSFVMQALPATDDAGQTWMPAAASGSYGLNVKLKNPTAATAFINFLMSPEGINDYVNKSGSLPAIANADFKLDPALKVIQDLNTAGKTAPFMDQLWPNPSVQQAHLVGVADMFGGKAKPADVLAKMDAAYKKK